MKRGIVFALFLLTTFAFSLQGVLADTLFYDGFSAAHPLSTGWNGSYPEPPLSADLFNDIYSDNAVPHNDYYMVTKDNAAASISVSTLGYENIELDYWRGSWATVSDALMVEWRVGDSGPWSLIELSQFFNVWASSSFNFPGSAENKPEIQIRFWMNSSNGEDSDPLATWDEVEVTGDATDSTPPMCSVDYLQHKLTLNTYLLNNSVYVNEEGGFYIYGSALDNETNIDNVQYNRSSPNNFYLLYTDADPVDGSFNELNEDWRSRPNDPDGLVNGWHNICCYAVDDSGNGQNAENSACQEFCVDTLNPGQVTDVVHSNPSACVSNYVNNAPSFSWSAGGDNGCSGINYYEFEVYFSNGSFYYADTTTDTEMDVAYPQNGEDYYIRVRAVDNAGNVGDWSNNSEHVFYDIEDPNVDIIGENPNVWYNDDFDVIEVDTDNLGLYLCEYKILNDGVLTLNWTATPCNQNITIDVSTYCPVDGLNNCKVFKRVTDNACNTDSAHRQWDLDRVAPMTKKFVGEHKYPGGLFCTGGNENCTEIDWFVTNETDFEFSCNDYLSGCNGTFYRIMFESNPWSEWIEYNGAFNLNEGDGIYKMEYYSADYAGNLEDVQNETDKVDTLAPVTNKTISEPQYIDFQGNLWVSGATNFTLTCEDSEVGCEETCYEVNSGEDGNGGEICDEAPLLFNLKEYDDGLINLSYWSLDHLWNMEEKNWQIDYLDNTPPTIQVLNPTIEEALDIQRCVQSIVAIVQDDGSGVQGVWAELEDSEGVVVRSEVLSETVASGVYETLMDKQLPAGNYTLKVYANDNIGNVYVVDVFEVLSEDVFVEFLSNPATGGPVSCEVNINSGGVCDLRFHVCMRGADSVKMWLDKFGDVVTPFMMNATISKSNESNYVGLMNETGPQTEAGLLDLQEGIINGRTTFDLGLDISANITQQIGPGKHELEYLIRSFITI